VGKTNCSGKTINGHNCGKYKEKQDELWYYTRIKIREKVICY
jgi:hypothetical protein